jgi:peptide/nickel transport system permease protein
MISVSQYARLPVLVGIALMFLALTPVLIGRLYVSPEMAEVFSAIPNVRPSLQHPLGTQSEGRDMLAVIMLGTPATLMIGLIGGGVAVMIGGLLGFTAGYFGGRIDAVIRTIVDVGLTIPPLAILIMVAASYPIASIALMGLIIAATQWMWATRIIRSQVLTLREREFVRVAKLSGISDFGIIFFELLPNVIPFIAASFVNAVTTAILASIGLEVLGLGSRQSYTLGNTIYEATYYTAMWRGMWWWWGPPIIILICVFVGLFLISNVLDRIANPKLERGF